MNYVQPTPAEAMRLADVVQQEGLICDGDWVESKDQDPAGDVRLIQLADVGVGAYLNKSARFLTSAKAKELRCTFLQPGDLLVARMPDPIGRACIFPGDARQAVTVVDVCIVRPDPRVCDPRWLCWIINAPDFAESVLKQARGATRQRISRTELERLSIPRISLREQRRIAAILDEADALRAKRRAALAQLDEMARAIFVEMFGVPSDIECRWRMVPLGNLLDFLTSGSRGWAEHYADDGELFLRIQNVRHDELDLRDVAYVKAPDTAEARRTKVEPGDVLLSITADLGRTATVPDGLGSAYINQHLAILRSKHIHPRFLSAYLASPFGQEQVLRRNRQGVKAGLNFDDIRSIFVPDITSAMQSDFAERLAQIDMLRRKARSGLGHLDALFASLQHRAFRREL